MFVFNVFLKKGKKKGKKEDVLMSGPCFSRSRSRVGRVK